MWSLPSVSSVDYRSKKRRVKESPELLAAPEDAQQCGVQASIPFRTNDADIRIRSITCDFEIDSP